MRPPVSIIIPAWNEEDCIGDTLRVLREAASRHYECEMIVVDDGSTDRTADRARPFTDKLIRHERNLGKGAALMSGWRVADADVLLFLDADLGGTAEHAPLLAVPVMNGETDMTIARFTGLRKRKGGFGFVKKLASYGIRKLGGFQTSAPLSGQRAVRKEILHKIGGLSAGFGIEVGLTIDAARAGYRILEVPLPLHHRETGRDLRGFLHRGKQFVSVGRTLYVKWRGAGN